MRSEETEVEYRRRFEELVRAFARYNNIADIEVVDPIAFGAHVVALMARVRPATRRL